MRVATTIVVQILGDVGELRKECESANYQYQCAGIKSLQQVFQIPLRLMIVRLSKTNGSLPDRLDQVEPVASFLFLQRVTEKPAEQPDIFAQRRILIGLLADLFRQRGRCEMKASLSNRASTIMASTL